MGSCRYYTFDPVIFKSDLMNRKKHTFCLAGVSLVICLCLIACKATPSLTPQITSFAPSSARGGTSMVITGANFNTSVNGNIVTINGHAATATAVSSSGMQLTVTVPLRAGSSAVTVNGRTATSASSFSYEWVCTSVTTLAGSGFGVPGFADDLNGKNVRFNNPTGIAVDTAGNMYVADTINHKI